MSSIIEIWQRNEALMEQEDKDAKDEGKLVNRYIREHYADGYAFYKIIRENKNTVRIRVVTEIGDDWSIPYWGEETTIDKEYAISNIKDRDSFAKLFS